MERAILVALNLKGVLQTHQPGFGGAVAVAFETRIHALHKLPTMFVGSGTHRDTQLSQHVVAGPLHLRLRNPGQLL